MIGATDMELFRRIDRRRGLLIRRWGPSKARRVDRLVGANLISWATEGSSRRDFGMRLTLTPKGKIVRNKL